MAILATAFTCPNGHSFTANAKLRARCPTCGAVAKREFKAEAPKPDVKPEPTPEPKKPTRLKGPRLVKQGNPNRPPRVRRTRSLADTIREAKDNAAVAKTRTPKGPKPVTKIAKGLVTKRRVARNVTPKAGARPPKTSISKVTKYGAGGNEPYWEKVKSRFMPRLGR